MTSSEVGTFNLYLVLKLKWETVHMRSVQSYNGKK